jgi:hypothetical protein
MGATSITGFGPRPRSRFRNALQWQQEALPHATALGLLTGSEPSRAESTYPWCAQYRGAGARNFGFSTLEQGRATVSGIGGY